MTRVENIIAEVAKKNNINFNIDNKQAELKSLNIDSLAAMNLIIQIEEKLNVTLNDDVLMSIKTLGDLIKAFEK